MFKWLDNNDDMSYFGYAVADETPGGHRARMWLRSEIMDCKYYGTSQLAPESELAYEWMVAHAAI
jgi:hypothetical protein